MPRLLEQVHETMVLRGLSRRTMQTYRRWIVRFIRFHELRHPRELGASEVREFLSDLAIERELSPKSQKQAVSALVFLYRHVLDKQLGDFTDFVRAKAVPHVPVVLTRNEVASILARLQPPCWLVIALIYGSGLRLMECLSLRIKDIDVDRREIVVRAGKGGRDRRTMVPVSLIAAIQEQGNPSTNTWLTDGELPGGGVNGSAHLGVAAA